MLPFGIYLWFWILLYFTYTSQEVYTKIFSIEIKQILLRHEQIKFE